MAPLFEFVGGQRAPFPIAGRELIIGRAADCGLQLGNDAASDRHARVTVDAAGKVYIQDLDTQTGTLRNGNYVYGVQQLDEGDRVEIGGVTLLFRAAAATVPIPAAVAAAAPVTAARPAVAPAAAPARAGADERTRMPVELPPEVRAVLAAREQQKQSVTPPPPVQAAPAGIIVGTPEPEPDNFRTVQMQAPDLAALGIDPASLPPAAKPIEPKRTMMGIGTANLGYMPTTELPAQNAPPPKSKAPAATQPTMMGMPPPAITQQPLAPPIVSSAPPYQPPPQPYQPPPPAQPSPYAQPQAQPPTAMAGAPQPVQYDETAKTNPLPSGNFKKPYTPPAKKGMFGSFSRAFAFMGQIFSLAGQHKALFKPLLWDVMLTTPIMAIFAVLEFVIPFRAEWQVYAMMALEGFLLYFTDYACNAITASLMYDFATTGQATMQTAGPRVRKALPGILTFAAVSALLDVAATYARERNDLVAKIVLRVLRAIWTTATYVIMPALVIEGVSFGAAFKRSKELMDHDPTGVGAGVVAMSITSYIVAIICFPLAYFLMRFLGGHVHPAIGVLAGMLIINLYWAVSGWLKISYATCFYLWARECERVGSTDNALAPTPLRAALDAA